MLDTTARLARAALAWPVTSQHVSRRNALVAGTALAERRRELEEVEEFLTRHAAARDGRPTTLEVAVRPA